MASSSINRKPDPFEFSILKFVADQGEEGCTTEQIARATMPSPPTEAISFLMRSGRIKERESEAGIAQVQFLVVTDKGQKSLASERPAKASEPAKAAAPAGKGAKGSKGGSKGKGAKGATDTADDTE